MCKYHKDFSKFLKYDETSASGLRWTARYSIFSRTAVGDVAGSLDDKDGYWRIHALGGHFKAHKIVWALFNKVCQEGSQIDHINGIRNDNRIENLRLVDKYTNQQNKSRNKNNTTGTTGVAFSERTQPSGYYSKYTAWFCHNAKAKRRSFSVQKYGDEEAFNRACQWREKEIARHNEEGLTSYTERHGK